jgi:hypothetical protein
VLVQAVPGLEAPARHPRPEEIQTKGHAMKTVWKYSISHGLNVPMMPRGALPLAFAEQGGSLCLWALVEPAMPKQPRTFMLHGTGHEDIAPNEHYIGTAQQGPFVWHLFEVQP